MIDVHTHLKPDTLDTVGEYFEALKKTQVDASVLILNGKRHFDAFWKNAEQFFALNHTSHLAFLLDIRHPQEFENSVKLAAQYGVEYSIKLHPRQTDITEQDFDSIVRLISQYDFRTVIVDSFIYGGRKENNCYIELSSCLAERFQNKKIVMAHFGGIRALETMLRTRPQKNIFYDCSLSISYLKGTSVWMDLRHCILHSIDRTMFGSDMPEFAPERSRDDLLELLGEQPDSLLEDLFSTNARRVFFD